MRRRLSVTVRAFLLMIPLFMIQKPLFMLLNLRSAASYPISEWISVIWHGISLDMTMSAYLAALPALIASLSVWVSPRICAGVIRWYYRILAPLLALACVADAAIYPYWGFKLNSAIWFYLSSPKDAAASIEWGSAVWQLLIVAAMAWIIWRVMRHVPVPLEKAGDGRPRLLQTLACLITAALLMIPIRGGFSASVANESRAYFSNDMFLNHSAVNPAFSLLDSSLRQQRYSEKYRFMDSQKASDIAAEISMVQDGGQRRQLLTDTRPNIVLIILEGFAAEAVGAVGGDPAITPNLNEAAQDGITFTKLYANSFRTDRGLVSVLNGYPAQPTSSIMKYPSKSQTLPGIAARLRENGYGTSMYYGGDIDFTNMRSFFFGSGFDTVTGQDGLDFRVPMARWGYDDRVMLNFYADKIIEKSQEGKPFFSCLLTLSSHEPFDVPFDRFEDPYANSAAFTDDCLGDFIRKVSVPEVWDKTLFILIPDHSFVYPADVVRNSPRHHHIFMVWAGGAVESARIDRIGTQTDLAATLFGQMGIDSSDFTFSRDLLAGEDEGGPAFYTFNDGFGLVRDSEDWVVWDYASDSASMSAGDHTDELITEGKALLQTLMEDFDAR